MSDNIVTLLEDSSVIFQAEAFERGASGEGESILLENAEGFLEAEAEFDLVPNLFGAGSFIDSVRISEKEFTLTLSWKVGATHSLLKDSLLRTLSQKAEAFEKLVLRYEQPGTGGWSSRIFEYHDIYITNISNFEALDDSNVRMVLTLLSPSGAKVNV